MNHTKILPLRFQSIWWFCRHVTCLTVDEKLDVSHPVQLKCFLCMTNYYIEHWRITGSRKTLDSSSREFLFHTQTSSCSFNVWSVKAVCRKDACSLVLFPQVAVTACAKMVITDSSLSPERRVVSQQSGAWNFVVTIVFTVCCVNTIVSLIHP